MWKYYCILRHLAWNKYLRQQKSFLLYSGWITERCYRFWDLLLGWKYFFKPLILEKKSQLHLKLYLNIRKSNSYFTYHSQKLPADSFSLLLAWLPKSRPSSLTQLTILAIGYRYREWQFTWVSKKFFFIEPRTTFPRTTVLCFSFLCFLCLTSDVVN